MQAAAIRPWLVAQKAPYPLYRALWALVNCSVLCKVLGAIRDTVLVPAGHPPCMPASVCVMSEL